MKEFLTLTLSTKEPIINQDRTVKLHTESIIIDGLNNSNWQDPEVYNSLHVGGLTAINATVAFWENFPETLDNIARWYSRFEKYSDIIMPIKNTTDIETAKAEGKCGIIFGFQNSSPIEDDLRRLRLFYELGVRIIQITYNNANFVGSRYLEPSDRGLSNFGIDLVAECNRLGILLDSSHTGYKTTLDTIEASTKPIAFTHAGPRTLFDHTRNKTAKELKALASKGSVVGAVGVGAFMAQGDNVTLSDYLDTVDYLVKLSGIDHVGIGMDFSQGNNQERLRWLFTGKNIDKEPTYQLNWPTVRPKEIENAAEFPNLTRGLLERGYCEQDVKKIIGGNFLRLFEQVWS